MDTKSKKYSRTNGFKAFLALIVLAAAAAIGAITGYLPAAKYISTYNGGLDLLYGSYYDSDTYSRMVGYAVSHYDLCDSLKETADIYQEQGVYFRVDKNGYAYQNNIRPSVTFKASQDGLSIYSGSGQLPNDLRYLSYPPENIVVYVGFTDSMLTYEQQQWEISHRNMIIIIVSSLILLAAALAAGIFLCRVIGESSDGEPVWNRFFGLWYEASAALIIAVLCLAVKGYSLSSNSSNSFDFGFQPTFWKIWIMVWWGIVAMSIAAVILYFLLSISVRVKNHKGRQGFLVYVILNSLWKAVRAVCRLIKNLYTGELFSADRAAKKLMLVDCVFFGTSVVLGVCALMCNASWNYGGMVFCVVLWLLVLGLFIFGRIRMVNDEAQLEQQIRELSRGNYAYAPKLSRNSAYAKSSEILSSISGKYKQGIEESVKAERMKIELVTNVSHDLKTPLTSIISYVDLLSKEQLTPKAAEYVDILQKKSERLKNIVADAFELAKTTSGEISVEHERLDLTRLSNQTLAEMEDKITAAGFTIKANICEPPVEVISDGKRLYRVIQNLLDNALKYSLKGTRIYYTLEKTDSGRAVITIKNIAAYEMDFTKEEILERFTRGDKARSTEGSGLGLSIAQGFTIACGGEFDIEIDGDMFKAFILLPMASPADMEGNSAKPQEITAAVGKNIPSEQKNTNETHTAAPLGKTISAMLGRLHKSDGAASEKTASEGEEPAPEPTTEPAVTVAADE